MRRTWVEPSCDTCHQGDYYPPGNVDAQARGNGWIIDRHGHAFCDEACRVRFRAEQAKGAPNPHSEVAP